MALANYREIFQGEIIAFSPGFVGASHLSSSQTPLVRREIIDSGFNRILKYYPVLEDGYYAEKHWEYKPFSARDIEELLAIPGVTRVNPYQVMPATARVMCRQTKIMLGSPAEVELKILPKEQWPLNSPEVPEPYVLDVVANAYGGLKVSSGDIMELYLPSYGIDQQGLPYIDSSVPPVTYQVRVVGTVSFPTRQLSWIETRGERIDADASTEQAYVHSPDVFLREADWQALWQLHAEEASYPHLSLGINIEYMSELNTMTELLRREFPGVSFVSMTEFVMHLNRYALLDHFYRAPPMFWQDPIQESHPLAQQDFRFMTAFLLFLNAGMLLASQMLTAIAGRRNEIGILKAIGSRQRDVVGMILMEGMIVAWIGTSIGFLLVRAAGIHTSITNGIPALEIVATTLAEMRIVLGLTVAMSLAFGVLPAWKVARLTVMAVFRNE